MDVSSSHTHRQLLRPGLRFTHQYTSCGSGHSSASLSNCYETKFSPLSTPWASDLPACRPHSAVKATPTPSALLPTAADSNLSPCSWREGHPGPAWHQRGSQNERTQPTTPAGSRRTRHALPGFPARWPDSGLKAGTPSWLHSQPLAGILPFLHRAGQAAQGAEALWVEVLYPLGGKGLEFPEPRTGGSQGFCCVPFLTCSAQTPNSQAFCPSVGKNPQWPRAEDPQGGILTETRKRWQNGLQLRAQGGRKRIMASPNIHWTFKRVVARKFKEKTSCGLVSSSFKPTAHVPSGRIINTPRRPQISR